MYDYLCRKSNNTRKIWAESIQDLFDFDIDEVEFVHDIMNIDPNDIDIVEFFSLENYKNEISEYLV